MPRRRTIKARATSKRAKPKAPVGDVGADLEGETKQNKLEVLLKDFDDEVECRAAEMASYFDDLISKVQKMYQLELMKIPTSVRNMKMADFTNSGGSVDEAKRQQQSKQIDDLINSVKTRPHRRGGAASQLETIDENQNASTVAPPTNAKRGATKTAARTSKRTRKQLSVATPLNARSMNTGWETPLQTPAFDPRLPMTPAVGTVRKVRPGEKTMYMLVSENGSPIVDDKRDRTLCVPNLPGIDLKEMDEDALAELHDTIGSILKIKQIY